MLKSKKIQGRESVQAEAEASLGTPDPPPPVKVTEDTPFLQRPCDLEADIKAAGLAK